MTQLIEKDRVLKVLTDGYTLEDREFTHKEISTRARAYHSNVCKLVRKLETEGIVERTGGKGVAGNPLRFRIVSTEKLWEYSSR